MDENGTEIFKFLILPTEIWVKRQKGVETNILIFCKPPIQLFLQFHLSQQCPEGTKSFHPDLVVPSLNFDV